MPSRITVHVVDDDDAVRDSLCLLLRLHGYVPHPHVSGDAFLAAIGDAPASAIVLLDLRMPGTGGAAVQAALAERNVRWPVIILTAHGDAASARNALKSGACDFIEKPVEEAALLAALEHAAAEAEAAEAAAARRTETARRLARLTPREREVFAMVVAGRHNREVAAALGISPRTVEVYKARLMDKLDVERLPDLIRLSLDSAP
jgi:RNA polymerase sigma factor (sigma-70 family)